jgi:hypothetical protein
MRLRLLALALLAGTLVLSGSALAAPRDVTHGASDEAAARAVVLHREDLPRGGSGPIGTLWRGGAIQTPDLRAGADAVTSACPSLVSKESRLVTTGAALATFRSDDATASSATEVLQTPSMVLQDWQVAKGSAFESCFRSVITASGNARVVEARRLDLPKLGDASTGFRLELRGLGTASSIGTTFDVIILRQGRTEVELLTTAPLARQASSTATDIRLARILAGRITV